MSEPHELPSPAAGPRRLRVLLSAYACEPGKGSEPGTGWNLAMELSRHCDVTVLTRSNNRPAIERVPGPKPAFIYHDLPSPLRFLKKTGALSTQAYYALWQRSIGRNIPAIVDLGSFEIFHHVTFNSFEVVPGLLTKFSGLKVWGPVGGGQRAPAALLPTFCLKSQLMERLRSLRVSISSRSPGLIRGMESCDLVLFANDETRNLFKSLKLKSCGQMIDVGVDQERFAPSRAPADGHRIFSASNFEARKGTRLLLLAFQQAHRKNPALTLRLAGDGPGLENEREWVRSNGMSDVIHFSGRCGHDEMAGEFAKAGVFVFPSIRDTSGAIVLEAMACGLPVICLDHQGARQMVDGESGIRIKPQSLEQTVDEMANAIIELSSNHGLRESMGHHARERVLMEFSWDRKSERLASEYRRLVVQNS